MVALRRRPPMRRPDMQPRELVDLARVLVRELDPSLRAIRQMAAGARQNRLGPALETLERLDAAAAQASALLRQIAVEAFLTEDALSS